MDTTSREDEPRDTGSLPVNPKVPREITLKDGRKVTVMVELCPPFKDPAPDRRPSTRHRKSHHPHSLVDLEKAIKKANHKSAHRFGAPKKHRRRNP